MRQVAMTAYETKPKPKRPAERPWQDLPQAPGSPSRKGSVDWARQKDITGPLSYNLIGVNGPCITVTKSIPGQLHSVSMARRQGGSQVVEDTEKLHLQVRGLLGFRKRHKVEAAACYYPPPCLAEAIRIFASISSYLYQSLTFAYDENDMTVVAAGCVMVAEALT
ncbi:hypothetical protein BDR06DRAFT_975273 [Suillus hirtellus]|nr:hypothetical protein BDR06DRAFT_975273 [Suillus hirtellus]